MNEWKKYANFPVRNNILWRIDPLLGKYLITKNETTAVAMQQLGKHASAT
jgi:hypothetical protein